MFFFSSVLRERLPGRRRGPVPASGRGREDQGAAVHRGQGHPQLHLKHAGSVGSVNGTRGKRPGSQVGQKEFAILQPYSHEIICQIQAPPSASPARLLQRGGRQRHREQRVDPVAVFLLPRLHRPQAAAEVQARQGPVESGSK